MKPRILPQPILNKRIYELEPSDLAAEHGMHLRDERGIWMRSAKHIERCAAHTLTDTPNRRQQSTIQGLLAAAYANHIETSLLRQPFRAVDLSEKPPPRTAHYVL